MARTLKYRADSLAALWRMKHITESVPQWETLRDWVDGETFSDLDCTRLDLLTDMIFKRLTPLKRLQPF